MCLDLKMMHPTKIEETNTNATDFLTRLFLFLQKEISDLRSSLVEAKGSADHQVGFPHIWTTFASLKRDELMNNSFCQCALVCAGAVGV